MVQEARFYDWWRTVRLRKEDHFRLVVVRKVGTEALQIAAPQIIRSVAASRCNDTVTDSCRSSWDIAWEGVSVFIHPHLQEPLASR